MEKGQVWLDLTRTLTAVGRPAQTGIDRVERAWAEHFLEEGETLRGLCRTTRGYVLLAPRGVRHLIELAGGRHPLGNADVISRALGRAHRPRDRAEAALRDIAVDRCPRWALSAMARRCGPSIYFNVGHASLDDDPLRTLRRAGAEVVVLLHDAIPLTHPHLVPPDQPKRFAQKLDAVSRSASLVLTVSEFSRDAIARHLPCGSSRIVVAPPGVAGPSPVDDRPRSGFVAIGTLEPRKNHEVLLRCWDGLAGRLPPADMPALRIFGRPGWKGDDIRRAIERHPLHGRCIFLETAADDEAVRAALMSADALLYPTFAEGFGLPPWEALAHGALPICSDLPVLRQLLGSRAVYADPTDPEAWTETIIQRLSAKLPGPDVKSIAWPAWADHFEIVTAAVATLRDGGRNGEEARRKGRE